MLDNLVNIHDAADAFRKAGRALRSVGNWVTGNSRRTVESAWRSTAHSPDNWWDIPEVRERWNRLLTGDPRVEYYEDVAGRYLAGRERPVGLSLGCGTGFREVRWAAQCEFGVIEAIDLSEPRIERARKEAAALGLADVIDYRVGDIYEMPLESRRYDVVFAEQSLHHFTPLVPLLEKIRDALKDDGLFVVNEFVGPTRFQWTDRQLEAVDAMLALLPERLRERLDGRGPKRRHHRPSRLRMLLADPSEAVQSADIMPALSRLFDVVEVREYGGTVLQLLFSGIAHNFATDDPQAREWLDACFRMEDLLLRQGELPSDFVLAVCRTPAARPSPG